MNITDELQDNTILIIPNEIKNKVLKEISNKKELLNIKIMSLNEFRDHLFFSYDDNAILYIMDNYGYNVDYSKELLNNLYYIDNDYDNSKLHFLYELKNMLISNKLLTYDIYFKDYIKNKNIIVYEYNNLDKFSIDYLNKINAKIINNKEYNIDNKVYMFNTLEEEVENLFIEIAKLIDSGIDINKIKITNINEEYLYTIKRYSNIFNIPVLIKDNYIYSSNIVKSYLKVLKETNKFYDSLEYIKNNYNLNNEDNYYIYNKLLNISNKYNTLDYSFDSIYKLVEYKLKNIKVNNNKLDKYIEIIDLDNNLVSEDEYVFLLSFNLESIPRLYKDEDYISDNLKEKYNLLKDNTNELNIKSKIASIKSIKEIKNLYISSKKRSIKGEFNISPLVSILNYELIEKEDNFKVTYSDKYIKLKLSKYLDDYIKYGIYNKNLELLYSNINIDYLSYDNKFNGIDKLLLLDRFKKGLTLSYTSIDNYFHCAFKYYLTNVLRLDIYEENFSAIIGTMFHYILSISLEDNFDFDYEYKKYMDSINISKKEEFFLNNLKKELRVVIDEVRSLYNSSSLDNYLLEYKVNIDKSSVVPVTFTGIIDKLMYKDNIVSIIDYKTGTSSIDLDSVKYGLSMQLPVYLYLVSKSNIVDNPLFAGFYLQKILSSKSLELDKSSLKLIGYSTNNIDRLSKFIPDYIDSRFVRGMKMSSKGFYSYAKVISDNEIDNLIKEVDNKIDEARDNILEGNYIINPKELNKERIGCNYCKFKDICFKTNNDYVRIETESNYAGLD